MVEKRPLVSDDEDPPREFKRLKDEQGPWMGPSNPSAPLSDVTCSSSPQSSFASSRTTPSPEPESGIENDTGKVRGWFTIGPDIEKTPAGDLTRAFLDDLRNSIEAARGEFEERLSQEKASERNRSGLERAEDVKIDALANEKTAQFLDFCLTPTVPMDKTRPASTELPVAGDGGAAGRRRRRLADAVFASCFRRTRPDVPDQMEWDARRLGTLRQKMRIAAVLATRDR